MVEYCCETCKFRTIHKGNFDKHILTSKHIKLNPNSTFTQQKLNIDSTIIQPKKNTFSCKYCDKKFSYMQSMYRHIKYSCTKNKDEDMKELVRLMNLQIQQKDQELRQKDKQLETQSKQISKLMGKLDIRGSFNTTNIQNNIQLLAYKDTDISHLTDKDYAFCIKKVNFCVKNMIEKIHFNPSKPENMNLYISNVKDKYMMMYENGNWNMKQKVELDTIYQEKEMLLEQWLEEGQYKYPEIKRKFMQYLDNKDKDDTINWIKEEIKLMMYNKRELQLKKNGGLIPSIFV